MKIALAEALVRRKELQAKLDRIEGINQRDLFEIKVERRKAAENIDDIYAQVPRISFSQVTSAYDWHAKQLRKIDAMIQKANWDTEIEVEDEVMGDYVDPYVEKAKKA